MDKKLAKDARDYIKAQSNLLLSYRIGKRPSNWTLDTLDRLSDVQERLEVESG